MKSSTRRMRKRSRRLEPLPRTAASNRPPASNGPPSSGPAVLLACVSLACASFASVSPLTASSMVCLLGRAAGTTTGRSRRAASHP